MLTLRSGLFLSRKELRQTGSTLANSLVFRPTRRSSSSDATRDNLSGRAHPHTTTSPTAHGRPAMGASSWKETV